MNKQFNQKPGYQRRDFILNLMKVAGATALISLPGMNGVNARRSLKVYTVQDIIDIILKEIPGAPFSNTVDTLKSGNASQRVSGIVTTMFATVDVIKQAAEQNANFIIAHEPTFYNHTDDPNWVPNNKVVHSKQELIKKLGITVWRFHDYWHSHHPDGIFYGVLKQTGWHQYYKEGEMMINIPPTSLKNVAEHLKSSLGVTHIRVIGDLSLNCKSIGLMPGAAGGNAQISFVEKNNPDVMIVGETPEWETMEYYRDKVALGNKSALIVLGHSLSEEPGMEWLVHWLKPLVPGLNITHITSGSPSQWL